MTDNTPLNAFDELSRHCDSLGVPSFWYDKLIDIVEVDRKKQIEQAYSDGFQKASKGAFKSQQEAKREAVEKVLDRLEAQFVEEVVVIFGKTEVKKQVPLSAIEAERNKLKGPEL